MSSDDMINTEEKEVVDAEELLAIIQDHLNNNCEHCLHIANQALVRSEAEEAA